jgi:hypothetical protein
MPILEDQIKWYLSGGDQNIDVFQSIGGTISSLAQIKQDEFNNLWGDLGSLDLKDGITQYRVVYVKNESINSSYIDPRLLFILQDAYVSVQWNLQGVNKIPPKLATELTAPATTYVGAAADAWKGVTEDYLTTKMIAPTLPPRSFIALFLKRTIPGGNTVDSSLKQTMKLEVIGGGGPVSAPPPPPDPEPPPGGGGGGGGGGDGDCIPTGWYWPDPVKQGELPCGHADYLSPNFVNIDPDPVTPNQWIINCYTAPDWKFANFGPFKIKDNANAYKTYLQRCEEPECGTGGGGGGGTGNLDVDGTIILNEIDTKGHSFHIKNVNLAGNVKNFERDDDGLSKKTEGGLTYWRFEARDGGFASGGSNRTARPEFNTGASTQSGVGKARDRGYIGLEDDPRDLEFTCITRVDGIGDNSENWSIKCRGNGHSDANEKTLTMSFGYPYSKRKDGMFDKEISHPSTDYFKVNVRWSSYPLPGEMKWIGLKCVIYNINNNKAIHCDLYVDDNPLIMGSDGKPTGAFRNQYKLVWDYEESKNDTPTWAGPAIQFRVDQVEILDIASFNLRAIKAPKGTATASPDLPLRDDIDTGFDHRVTDGDILYPSDD